MKPDVHPNQVDCSGEVSSVVYLRFVIAMGMLEVVGAKQPMQSECLWDCHQQDEISPIKNEQRDPQGADQANL
jgi:hypothetical protein